VVKALVFVVAVLVLTASSALLFGESLTVLFPEAGSYTVIAETEQPERVDVPLAVEVAPVPTISGTISYADGTPFDQPVKFECRGNLADGTIYNIDVFLDENQNVIAVVPIPPTTADMVVGYPPHLIQEAD
jgi:hypothetical protein